MKPSWESIRTSSILLCTVSATLTVIACLSGPTWNGIILAVITGACIAAGFYIHLIISMSTQIDILLEANRAMRDLNAHLIADKVKVTIEEQGARIEFVRPSIH